MSRPVAEAADESVLEIRLLGVPVALWKRTALHHEALNREFEIIRAGLPTDAPPNRLNRLVSDVEGRFGDLSGGNSEKLESAFTAGESSIDLTFRVPKSAAAPIGELSSLFDMVDEFCSERRDLLSMTSTDEMIEFRRWFLGEFTRQIEEGRSPLPWPGGSKDEDVDPIIRFGGELDISTAESLRADISRLRREVGGDITVDLSDLTFVDSVGLSLLVMAHTSLCDEDRSLRIVMPEALRPLIELSGLHGVLQLEFVSD